MTETWKNIEGYEGLYQVSNLGNIRSLVGWDGHKYVNRIKLINQCIGTTPYLFVCLHKDKKQKRFDIHRLVAKAFVPNPNNLPVVMHIDDNPKNNNVKNLKWGTQKENCNSGAHNQKLSQSMMGKCGELNNFYGKKHTDETKEKIRQNRIGKYSKGNSPNAKKVICDNIIYDCMIECAEHYNIEYNTMRDWVNYNSQMPQEFIDKGLRWLDE